MMAEVAVDQKIGTLLRMHEEAFRQIGGVPEEILYDRMNGVARKRRAFRAGPVAGRHTFLVDFANL